MGKKRMADEEGKTFPTRRDTVSQSAPCTSLPSSKSNSDTEYGGAFQISLLGCHILDRLDKCSFYKTFLF